MDIFLYSDQGQVVRFAPYRHFTLSLLTDVQKWLGITSKYSLFFTNIWSSQHGGKQNNLNNKSHMQMKIVYCYLCGFFFFLGKWLCKKWLLQYLYYENLPSAYAISTPCLTGSKHILGTQPKRNLRLTAYVEFRFMLGWLVW